MVRMRMSRVVSNDFVTLPTLRIRIGDKYTHIKCVSPRTSYKENKRLIPIVMLFSGLIMSHIAQKHSQRYHPEIKP